MADHYKVLGISRSATKAEIKDAFRKLAVQFHPDKHSHSAKSVRDDATRRFKQVSEAYEVLSDDRKRADYNLRSSSSSSSSSSSFYSNRTAGNNYHRDGGGYGYSSYGYGNRNGYGWSYYREGGGGGGGGLGSKFEDAIRYMSTRAFLLHIVFAGVLVGGMLVIETSKEALWKAQNSGKSFEEAMESIEKAKANGKRVQKSFDEAMDSSEKAKANGKRVQKSFGEAIEKAEANRKRV